LVWYALYDRQPGCGVGAVLRTSHGQVTLKCDSTPLVDAGSECEDHMLSAEGKPITRYGDGDPGQPHGAKCLFALPHPEGSASLS